MHHLFVDYENVQDIDLGALGDDPVELIVILGKDQKPPPTRLLSSLLERAGSLRLVKLQRAGRNALDMALSFHIGTAAARDPNGSFHILSEDQDYDPLIAHLQRAGVAAVRVEKSSPSPGPAPAIAHLRLEAEPDAVPPEPRSAPAVRPEPRTPAISRPEPKPAVRPATVSATVDKATNVANRLRRAANPPIRKARLLSHIRDQLRGRLKPGEDLEVLELLVESGFVAIDARNRVTYPGLAAR